MGEIIPKSPLTAIHEYAGQLTTKARELEQMEREYKILPGQSTEILESMIESFLHAIFKTMLYSEKYSMDDRLAAKEAAIKLLRESNIGLATPPIKGKD